MFFFVVVTRTASKIRATVARIAAIRATKIPASAKSLDFIHTTKIARSNVTKVTAQAVG